MAQQSLYRRYRPRRFSELKGQEHVVRALRNAVATHREGQAYLFSGPRGTGKTTSARILAKVLNCENPLEGEPCCECESCKSVEAGTSFDVIELDAASNNKVDDIRELIERVNLGTPGRHKVYILDEVHMLTPGAEAALLKTLEEPPPHVVFVLATTDPQKVRDTIRSRTQHLSFHLLNEKELEEHVRWVAGDAGIELTDDAVEAVVRQGGGSARDTLSALEVVAAGGGVAPEMMPLDEFVESIIERDPGRALAAVAASAHLGRDARSIAEAVLAHLRDCFLSIMAPELVQLPAHRAEVVSEQAHRLGAAAAVRSMEGLGDILVEMRHAPDPRVLLEVALVKLTSEAAGSDIAALLSRLERLERQVAQGGIGPSSATGPIPRPVPTDPNTGRAVLGGRAKQAAASAPAPAAPTDPTPAAPQRPVATRPAPTAAGPQPEPAAANASAAPATAPAPAPPSAVGGDLVAVFDTVVRPALKGMAKALYVVAQPKGVRNGALVIGFPNQGHADKAGQYRADIEKALSAAVGAAVTVVIEADAAAATTPAAAEAPDPIDHEVDLSDLQSAPPQEQGTHLDRIASSFPGSTFVEGSA
jgi:DNA polymerase-3 subunit gamma/tau